MNIEDKIELIKRAAKSYYDEDEQIITDDEFDDLVEDVRELYRNGEIPENLQADIDNIVNEDSVRVGVSDDEVSDNQYVLHEVPMLSLAKAKDEKTLSSFLEKTKKQGATGWSLQCKMDGFALSVDYMNDDDSPVLSTRGNGARGEDMSYLLSSPHVHISGLPATIDSHGNHVVVRGELFMSQSDFDRTNDECKKLGVNVYSNPRNGCVGIAKAAKKGLEINAYLSFVAYTLYVNGELTSTAECSQYGKFSDIFTVTSSQFPSSYTISNITSEAEVLSAIKDYEVARVNFTVPTDGVVIKALPENVVSKNMGSTGHHPNSQIAYKYPGVHKYSVLRDVIVTVGKTGRITPTAVFDPIVIDNSTITNATLHNYDWIMQRRLTIGSRIEVTKAGDVIPYISRVVDIPKGAQVITCPRSCPECGEETVVSGKYVLCVNSCCPSRVLGKIEYAVSSDVLKIDGLAGKTLHAVVKSGKVTDVADIFSLTVEDISQLPLNEKTVIGELRARKIIANIKKALDVSRETMLVALSVDGVGHHVSKLLWKRFDTIEAIQSATVDDLKAIESIGEITANDIVTGLSKAKNVISKLQAIDYSFSRDETDVSDSGDMLNGLSFAITGTVPHCFSNRKDFVSYVENNGGTFHSSPKKDTSFVVGDISSSSSKMKKALSLGVPVISAEEWMQKFF